MNAKTMMRKVVFGILLLTGCVGTQTVDDPPSVHNFDATRYMGVWYEIARMPQWFEKDLDHVTATYALEDGKLRITNRGFRNGKAKIATAVGHFADARDVGAFRISFFRPFYGDYRIIHLSPSYDEAIVTTGSPDALWILSRTAKLTPERLNELIQKAKRWGFDITALEYPSQR